MAHEPIQRHKYPTRAHGPLWICLFSRPRRPICILSSCLKKTSLCRGNLRRHCPKTSEHVIWHRNWPTGTLALADKLRETDACSIQRGVFVRISDFVALPAGNENYLPPLPRGPKFEIVFEREGSPPFPRPQSGLAFPHEIIMLHVQLQSGLLVASSLSTFNALQMLGSTTSLMADRV